ncbi:MAG: paraquat-inducible protein A [Rhodospirillaceae bacterium]|nr:paraquat-inducible protein A [Rhodospirillaceae bacterium]
MRLFRRRRRTARPRDPRRREPRPDRPATDTLARRGTRRLRWLVGPALVGTLALLAAGIGLPTLSVETFPLIEDSVSVWEGLGVLWDDDQYFLFVVLLVFSLLFPSVKLVLALWVWEFADLQRRSPLRLVAMLDATAKWSMLDVLVIAVIVASLNLTVISGVEVHPGLYLFTAAIVFSKVLISWLKGRLNAAAPSPD